MKKNILKIIMLMAFSNFLLSVDSPRSDPDARGSNDARLRMGVVIHPGFVQERKDAIEARSQLAGTPAILPTGRMWTPAQREEAEKAAGSDQIAMILSLQEERISNLAKIAKLEADVTELQNLLNQASDSSSAIVRRLESERQRLMDRIAELRDDLQGAKTRPAVKEFSAQATVGKASVYTQTEDKNYIKMKEELAKLEQRLADFTSQQTALQTELDTVRSENARLQEQLSSVQSELEALKGQVEAQNAEKHRLEAEKSELLHEKRLLEERNQEKNQALLDKETEIKRLQEKMRLLAQQGQETTELREEIENLKVELFQEKTQSQTQSEQLRGEIQEKNALIQEKDAQIADLRKKLVEAEVILEIKDSEIAGLKAKLDLLTSQNTTLTLQNRDHVNQLQAETAKVSALREELVKKEAELSNLEDKMTKADKILEKLNIEQEELKRQLKDATNELEEVKEQEANLKVELDQAHTKVTELQTKLKQIELERDKLRKEVRDVKEIINKTKETAQGDKQKSPEITEDILKELRHKLKDVTKELQIKEEGLLATEQKLIKAYTEIERLESIEDKNKKLEAKNKELVARIDQMKEVEIELRKESKRILAKIDKANRENKILQAQILEYTAQASARAERERVAKEAAARVQEELQARMAASEASVVEARKEAEKARKQLQKSEALFKKNTDLEVRSQEEILSLQAQLLELQNANRGSTSPILEQAFQRYYEVLADMLRQGESEHKTQIAELKEEIAILKKLIMGMNERNPVHQGVQASSYIYHEGTQTSSHNGMSDSGKSSIRGDAGGSFSEYPQQARQVSGSDSNSLSANTTPASSSTLTRSQSTPTLARSFNPEAEKSMVATRGFRGGGSGSIPAYLQQRTTGQTTIRDSRAAAVNPGPVRGVHPVRKGSEATVSRPGLDQKELAERRATRALVNRTQKLLDPEGTGFVGSQSRYRLDLETLIKDMEVADRIVGTGGMQQQSPLRNTGSTTRVPRPTDQEAWRTSPSAPYATGIHPTEPVATRPASLYGQTHEPTSSKAPRTPVMGAFSRPGSSPTFPPNPGAEIVWESDGSARQVRRGRSHSQSAQQSVQQMSTVAPVRSNSPASTFGASYLSGPITQNFLVQVTPLRGDVYLTSLETVPTCINLNQGQLVDLLNGAYPMALSQGQDRYLTPYVTW